MKPRFSIARCCCGGGELTCLACNLASCGWTADGVYLVSNTPHPLGSLRGVIQAGASLIIPTSEVWVIWDYVNSSTFNHIKVTRTGLGSYRTDLYERGALVDSDIATLFSGSNVNICIQYDETSAFAIVADSLGADSMSVAGSVATTTSDVIARKEVSSTFNSLDWYLHRVDKPDCPKCGILCQCCTETAPYEWSLDITGPLTNNFYDKCSLVNGEYVLAAIGSGCAWKYIHSTGTYGEGIPTCLDRPGTMEFNLYLEKSGSLCRMRLDIQVIIAADPSEECFGEPAIYATPYAAVDTYCTGSHVLSLTNSPDICLGFPPTVTVTEL